jgi:hypothetical protein
VRSIDMVTQPLLPLGSNGGGGEHDCRAVPQQPRAARC